VATIGGRTEPRHIGAPVHVPRRWVEIFANRDDWDDSPTVSLAFAEVAHLVLVSR